MQFIANQRNIYVKMNNFDDLKTFFQAAVEDMVAMDIQAGLVATVAMEEEVRTIFSIYIFSINFSPRHSLNSAQIDVNARSKSIVG